MRLKATGQSSEGKKRVWKGRNAENPMSCRPFIPHRSLHAQPHYERRCSNQVELLSWQAGSDLGCQDCIDYIGSEFGGHAAKTMFAGRLQVSGRERPVLKVLIILEFAALRGAPNTGGGVNCHLVVVPSDCSTLAGAVW